MYPERNNKDAILQIFKTLIKPTQNIYISITYIQIKNKTNLSKLYNIE